jgi:formylglycine-generating enzyme required for sulfatase activity
MICPECGRETSNEQAFCKQCGAYVRSQFGKVLSTGPLVPLPAETGPLVRQVAKDSLAHLEWSEIEKLIIAEDNLWPAETVFALNTDEEPEPDVEPVADFDDALAEDDLEQSLSGQVKREALQPEFAERQPVEAAIEDDPHATYTPDLVTPPPTVPALPDSDTFLKTNPDMFAGVIAPELEPRVDLAPPPEPQSRKWRRILGVAALSLVPIAFFAGGMALGSYVADYTRYETPSETAVPPVAEELPRIIPPAGMTYVPGGSFFMGSNDGDTISKPPHFKSVEPFFIDTTEVTNAQYAEFIKATGQVPPRSWPEGVYPEAEANFPVTGINWYEAAEYAAWKGKRLPTEAEWEFAARGTDGRTYPWGDEWDASLANAGEDSKGLRPVGQGGVSPFGIYDMSGNAWEWTASDARSYPGGKEFPWSRMRLKIIRGGNWQSDERSATTYFRGFYGAAGEREYNGTSFRCVKDLPK